MAMDIKLPELGEGVTEGELIKWLVKPGDSVKPDQAIAEVMTDKATVEVPSPRAGIVKELKFKSGDIIKVESTLLTLDAGNASSAAIVSTSPSSTAIARATKTSAISSSPAPMATTTATTSDYLLKLPELGEGVTEGELIKWLVNIGDSVKADQSVAEIMTDKATVEVPTPKTGVIAELKFKPGNVVKVDSVLAVLKTSGTATVVSTGIDASVSTNVATGSSASINNLANSNSNSNSTSTSTGTTSNHFYPPVMDSRVLATPATRRLARELQIDINALAGTGLAGRVTREDVLRSTPTRSATSTSPLSSSVGSASATGSNSFLSQSIPKPSYVSNRINEEERVAIRGIRKKIAENMQLSKHVIPHFTLMDEADVSELVQWRESLKDVAEKAGTKITYLPFVMKALIATVREFPMFNASIDDAAQEIVYKKYFNLGFAADTPNGLVVPVIKNADQKSILELSKEILDLSLRARDGKLKPDEMKGATITITNIGSVGGTYATPIINHPEVAILGMYKIQDQLYLNSKGEVKNKKVMNYTITADHRLIDGAVAARFLKSFLSRVQKPSVMMLDMQ